MNRREFLKGSALAGAAAVARSAAGEINKSSKIADGRYALDALAGEPLLAAAAEDSVAVSWAVQRLATGGVESRHPKCVAYGT